jgi:HK97 family phage prohead protease
MTWEVGNHIECDLGFMAHTVSDVPDGYIAGIASTPATDLYRHRVLAGAFDRSITRKGLDGPKGVKLLAFHDWSKPAGVIKKLATVGQDLGIEAQLNLNVSYVRDLYEIAKQNQGLSFSVGFLLEDFEFPNEKDTSEDAALIVKSGELIEVSVVCFPACADAKMAFVKQQPPDTMAEFERALIAEGVCQSRNEAHRIALAAKRSIHLFQPRPLEAAPPHPLLDVHKLKAATDLAARAKELLRI